jgi:hypothetical protein
MQNKKLALFYFSDPTNIGYLAKTLIEHGWTIKAPVSNIEVLEKEGVERQHLRPFSWGAENSFISPSQRSILGIMGRTKDREMLSKNSIEKIDLVCVDFIGFKGHLKDKKKLWKSLDLEITKAFLLMLAIRAGKIPLCQTHDREMLANWMIEGSGQIKDRRNRMLRLMGSASLSIGREFLDIGSYCDRLRK